MKLLRGGLRDLGSVFVHGLRLLGQHWPQLLALYLAGAAGRMGFLWLALWVSKFSSLLGVLLMPLAPLCTLLSLVFMLQALGESIPAYQQAEAGQNAGKRLRSNLMVAAQVLIPFLAVYAAQGLLQEDIRLFIYDSTVDEAINNPLSANYARTLIASGWTLTLIVVLALIARKLIAAYDLPRKALRWGAIGSYLEALWLVTLSASFAAQIDQVKEWVTSRALVAGIAAWWTGLTSTTGTVGQVARGVHTWLTTTLGSLDDLVVVPVAWLAIGATIYGSKLIAQAFPTHEQVTRRLERIPNPVRRAAEQLAEPITTPVRNIQTAISKVAAAGIIPMTLFCVGFSFLVVIKLAVAWLGRLLLGPQPPLLRAGIEPYVALLERGAYLILAVALIAAAVNRVLLSRRAQEQTKNATESTVNSTLPTAT